MTNDGMDQITWQTPLPADSIPCKLAGSETKKAKGGFGEMTYSRFDGVGFSIGFNQYRFREQIRLELSNAGSFLILYIPWVNEADVIIEGIGAVNLAEQQFDIFFTPVMSMTSDFSGGKEYQVCCFGFSCSFLQTYALHCPKLAALLELADNRTPAHLLDSPQFLSPDMITVISKILSCQLEPALAVLYFTGLLHELLVLLAIRVSALSNQISFSLIELELAQAVRKIITADFEQYHTVEQLARKVGTTEVRLQAAFKYLYGQTTGRFSREARLEKGRQLLAQSNHPLRVVCEMVGYADASNFSAAFKKQFGYWPGKIQKANKGGQ